MTQAIDNVTNAMMNVEDDVPPEIQRSLPTFTNQVEALIPGDTVYRGYRLAMGDTRDDKVTLADLRFRLRKAVAPAASRAKVKTGGEYSVCVSSSVWPDDHIHVVVAITRTDDGVTNHG